MKGWAVGKHQTTCPLVSTTSVIRHLFTADAVLHHDVDPVGFGGGTFGFGDPSQNVATVRAL